MPFASVADFGMSKKGAVYACRNAYGPLKWMAPEALSSQNPVFSKASDVFTFGVVLWEILTEGEEPYANISAREAGHAIIHGQVYS